jgi:hypothetical protein
LAGLAPPELGPVPDPPAAALEDPLEDEPADADEDPLAVVVVLVVVVGVVVVGTVAAAAVAVGTVSGGAPEVSAAVEPPPPHAAIAVATAIAAVSNASFLIRTAKPVIRATPSGTEWFHPPAASRAVVQVLLGELVAPVAEAQILHCPRQLGGCGGERQQLSDDLELRACVAIEVAAIGLGFDDDLAAGGGRTHAVLLARPHSAPMLPRAWIECRAQW